MDQVCTSWFKLDEIGSSWFKLDENWSNWFQLDQINLRLNQLRLNWLKLVLDSIRSRSWAKSYLVLFSKISTDVIIIPTVPFVPTHGPTLGLTYISRRWNLRLLFSKRSVCIYMIFDYGIRSVAEGVQVNNNEIVKNFLHISHNLTWYSAIVHKFTRIYPVCSTYELTKQFM